MKIIVTIWNFVIKHINSFKFKITHSKWCFKIKELGWGFSITQENDWNFKIEILVPLSRWILYTGSWDDNGVWLDYATWNDG